MRPRSLALLAMLLLTVAGPVVVPAPASAADSICAPDVSERSGDGIPMTIRTVCTSIAVDQLIQNLSGRVEPNSGATPKTLTFDYEANATVSVTGGLNFGVLASNVGGSYVWGQKLTASIAVTIPPYSVSYLYPFVQGTVYHGYQEQFPTNDPTCQHPMYGDRCFRVPFKVSRPELINFTVNNRPQSLALQFGVGGPCTYDCGNPPVATIGGGTLNVDLKNRTYDLRNVVNQSLRGGTEILESDSDSITARLTDGMYRDTMFTVRYNDYGKPTSVRYRLVEHAGGYARQTDAIFTVQVIGF